MSKPTPNYEQMIAIANEVVARGGGAEQIKAECKARLGIEVEVRMDSDPARLRLSCAGLL